MDANLKFMNHFQTNLSSGICASSYSSSLCYVEKMYYLDLSNFSLCFLSAWEDVLREMSASPMQAGGKVQYYSGQ